MRNLRDNAHAGFSSRWRDKRDVRDTVALRFVTQELRFLRRQIDDDETIDTSCTARQ